MHHHVFDNELVVALLRHVGFEVGISSFVRLNSILCYGSPRAAAA